MKLCLVENCNLKYYCKGYCIKHYQRVKRKLPLNMPDKTKDEYLQGNFDFIHLSRDSWALSLKRIFGNKCMICGWKEASCEAHHIIPRSKGGVNSVYNGVVLCPNHHKLADIKKISVEDLIKINLKALVGRAEKEPEYVCLDN